MATFQELLTPVLPKGERIYYLDDVLELLGSSFYKWMRKRTVTVINDRGAVTKKDIEEFLKEEKVAK